MGYYGGTLSCTNQCKIDISDCISFNYVCGNGIIEGNEQCDSTDLNGATCENSGYYGGTLTCNPDCTFNLSSCPNEGICGDGIIQTQYGEECDGNNLNGASCASELLLGVGTLLCDNNCHFDTSGCEYCGDGILQTANGETCDGTDLGGKTCLDLGYYGTGNLVCNSNCEFDISGCLSTGYCGDGILNGSEMCDGTDFSALSCKSIGYFVGLPESCDASCIPSENGCHNAIQWGTSNGDFGYGVAVDSSGYIYVTGRTQGDLDGNANAGNDDIFLTKYDTNGNKIWTKLWGSSNHDYGYGVTVDNTGYIYVTGSTQGVLDGNSNAGYFDIFLLRTNPNP